MSRARRLLAAAGAMAVFTVASMAPAGAQASNSDLVVTFDAPAASVTTSNPTVRGTVTALEQALLGSTRVQRINLSVIPEGGDAAVASTTQSPGRETPVSFSWNPSIPLNGNYRVEAVASGTGGLLGFGTVSGSGAKSFTVAAPPRAPQQVTAAVNPDGSVLISWAKNTEADILGYSVFRSDPGSGTFFQIGAPIGIAHTACRARCELRDDAVAAIGGEYGYQVLAFRPGASEPIASAASRTATANVPLPTTTTGPVDPGAPGGAPAGAAPAAKPALGSARGPAISSFLASRPPPKPPPPPKILEPPDTGFNRELPFGALPESDEEPGEEEAVPPADTLPVGSDADEMSQGRPLVPVAFGLLLLVVAAHLRVFVNRTRPTSDPAPRRKHLDDVELDGMAATAVVPVPGRSRRTVTVLPVVTAAGSNGSARHAEPFGRELRREPDEESADGRWDDGELDAAASAVDAAMRGGRVPFDRAFDPALDGEPLDEVEVSLLAPPASRRQPVGVGGPRLDSWDDAEVWEVVSPDR